MGIKKSIQVTVIITCYMLFINADCKKITGCAETVYSFEIGVKGYPDKDSIHIGDTLWLQLNTPDTLRDKITNELINYSGVANLSSSIGFQKLNGDVFTIKAVNKFKRVLIYGRETESADAELLAEYIFDDKSGCYQFKLGIIPTIVGIFRVVLSNAANVYRKSDDVQKHLLKLILQTRTDTIIIYTHRFRAAQFRLAEIIISK